MAEHDISVEMNNISVENKDKTENSTEHKTHEHKHMSNFLVKTMIEPQEVPVEEDTDAVDIEVNGWNAHNTQTATKWKNDLAETSYVYQTIMDKYKATLLDINISTLVFTSVASFLSLGRYGIDETNKTANYIFTSLVALFSVCSMILTGVYKFLGYTEQIDKILTYVAQIDMFYSKMNTMMQIDASLRENGNDFIKRESTTYSWLMNGPTISITDYDNALKIVQSKVRTKSSYKYRYEC
jgi:hypothetical protein